MNDEFLRNFFQIFRPKGLLTRDPGEPPETFEQLNQRAIERERAEEAQRAEQARQAAPPPVRRDIEGLGDNEFAAERRERVRGDFDTVKRRQQALGQSIETARELARTRRDVEGLGDNELAAERATGPASPAARRRQVDDLSSQNAVQRPDSRDIRRRDERRAAARQREIDAPKEGRKAAEGVGNNEFVVETRRNLEGDLGEVHDMDLEEVQAFEDRMHKAMSRGLPDKIGKQAILTAKAIRRDGVQPATARYFPTGKVVAKVDSLIKTEGVAELVSFFSPVGGTVAKGAAKAVTGMRKSKIRGLTLELQGRAAKGDREAKSALDRLERLTKK